MNSEEAKEIFQKGCVCFDEEDYFEAHELWEELWHEASGTRHPYLQGLIQTAVGLHHASNQNFKGARKLLASALQYLQKGKDPSNEVDLEVLEERILDVELVLQKIFAGEQAPIPYFKLPFRR